jgi:hypothetical protein
MVLLVHGPVKVWRDISTSLIPSEESSRWSSSHVSYVGMGQSHSTLQCLGCVQLDVGFQGRAETLSEDCDLLGLGEFIATGEVLVELVIVRI